VFISNEKKQVPIWNQKLSSDIHNPVVWDYHVIVLIKVNNMGDPISSKSNLSVGVNHVIFDFDSWNPFPCPALDYIETSFRPSMKFHPEYKQVLQ
jgi:hypothetical protein